MTRTTQAETRPAAAKTSKPEAPEAAARQKPAARPEAGLKPGVSKPAGKPRNWPVMEAALILVLIKIAVGAFYIWNRPAESGRESLAAPRQSRPAGPGYGPAAPAGPPEAAAVGQGQGAAAVGQGQGAAAIRQGQDYLAAALKATQPAQAQAAQEAQAAVPALASVPALAGALSAGALMVVGGQSAAARVGENIPLPPGGEELLQPAARLPQAAPPRQGTGGPAPASAPPAAVDLEALRSLREKEQDLARREALLDSKAGALGALESELNQRLQEVEGVKTENANILQRNEAVLTEQKALAEQQQKEDESLKDARLQHLVAAFGGMKPEQAGNLINSMDDDVAVAILSAMPGNKTGRILAMVNPDKAARLTKAISEKRIDPNLLLQEEEAAPAPAAPPGG